VFYQVRFERSNVVTTIEAGHWKSAARRYARAYAREAVTRHWPDILVWTMDEFECVDPPRRLGLAAYR
jgi:hypothetical protein